ncbi:MAG: hypothetical protein HZY74_12140 [Brevundimonas sp.]|nr:MAG: hypothetical protein HZY74_12140 [Brevundimonas sp.]
MKSLMITTAIAALALGLAACDMPTSAPAQPEVETVDMNAPVAEDPNAIPVDETASGASEGASTAAPADDSTLPANKRTSEESVQPDSETLFF